MIGLIVTGHGNFATGITSSFRLIAGGSPYNVASKMRMERKDTMEVIAGINLAALIEAGMGRENAADAGELARTVEETAREQVIRFLTDEEQAAAAAAKPAKKAAVRRGNPDGPKGVIVHARVDERLIHGQVAMVWTNTVGASRIVVVNDDVLKDDMALAGLKMAKPAGVKLSIMTVNRAVERLKENAYSGDRIFVITKNIADMAELIRRGVEIDRVNVGNVAKREGSRNIKKSVNLTEQDIADIQEMIRGGHSVTAQMIPNESDQSILNYLQ